jgi:adenylyltransferase/sulfurtransferase
MVRAGVGRYTIIDKDAPELANLHRQFLFDERDVARGLNKALAARRKLKRAVASARVISYPQTLAPHNADRFLTGHDLVLDALDNMPTRYLVNDWCVKNQVPWIYGGVAGATGMTLVIIPQKGPCLRCLCPEIPDPQCTPTPQTHGIINTMPALIAALQATEAYKLLMQSPQLVRAYRIVDLWSGQWQALHVERNPRCPCCGQGKFEFLERKQG